MSGKSAAELLRDIASSNRPIGRFQQEMGQASANLAFKALADLIDAEIDGIVECQNGRDSYSPSAHHAVRTWAERRGMPMEEGETISDWLNRWFIARPRFEDGDIVQWGADDIDWGDGINWKFNAIAEDGRPLAYSGMMDAVASMTENGRVKRITGSVNLSDGLPAERGQTVYLVPGAYRGRIPADCERLTVVSVTSAGIVVLQGSDMFGEGVREKFLPETLTHTRPDSQSRIEADALLHTTDYWGCSSIECYACPALIDGKRPYELYGVELYTKDSACAAAQRLDLMRRQRELDERKGGAE